MAISGMISPAVRRANSSTSRMPTAGREQVLRVGAHEAAHLDAVGIEDVVQRDDHGRHHQQHSYQGTRWPGRPATHAARTARSRERHRRTHAPRATRWGRPVRPAGSTNARTRRPPRRRATDRLPARQIHAGGGEFHVVDISVDGVRHPACLTHVPGPLLLIGGLRLESGGGGRSGEGTPPNPLLFLAVGLAGLVDARVEQGPARTAPPAEGPRLRNYA